MATRKRAKSYRDINAQIARINDIESNSRWLGLARQIANTYQNNMAKSQRFQRDLDNVIKTSNAQKKAYDEGGETSQRFKDISQRHTRNWNRLLDRKYVDYTTDKAKAASNG